MKPFIIPLLIFCIAFSPMLFLDKVAESEVRLPASPATSSPTSEVLLKPKKKFGPPVMGTLRTVEETLEQALHVHSKKKEGQDQSTQHSRDKGIVQVKSSSASSF